MGKISRKCPMCGQINTLEVSDKIIKQIERYEAGYGYIQDIELDATDREFIKTGFCKECQSKLFSMEV